MESLPEATSTTGTAATVSPSEERKRDKEMVHKTKVIQFFGRTTPIILQNDNGPCPLLAICNVLLLKNHLNLSPDIPEVSQEKLLSLVAERLIDSNSNVNNKDAGYIENQQQNIADAIDLLPRLTTGIDVNIKFRRIDDFEFTPECAIFDLLDIPLYHGWIVDPQDRDTAEAIGSKSYNTLMGELVALESRNIDNECKKNSEDDYVDFAAATTATLGVPSPCLSRGRSFEDSSAPPVDHQKARKGDVEETAELLRVLELSKSEMPSLLPVDAFNDVGTSVSPDGTAYPKSSELPNFVEKLGGNGFDENQNSCLWEESTSGYCKTTLMNHNVAPESSETVFQEATLLSAKMEPGSSSDQSTCEESTNLFGCKDVETRSSDALVHSGSSCNESSQHPSAESHLCISGKDEHGQNQTASSSDVQDKENKKHGGEILGSSNTLIPAPDSDSSKETKHCIDEPESFTGVDGSEPIYEGEDNILVSGVTVNQNREPMYEGEVILAEQGEKGCTEAHNTKKDEISPKEGELVRNFLKSSASQLTICGLFRLRDDLKERELCVFFRNNHFNTMFKFEGELYILATDQGYINQPDLVWEKLNEVNGDTVYMTGSFKEFKVENQGSNTWDEQNAVASTADYLANIDHSAHVDPNMNSDWQLALALQQQEFEQQPPQRQSESSGSRLVTGPQVSRNSGRQTPHPSKQESKSSKDKCTMM